MSQKGRTPPPPAPPFDMEAFKRDREQALLSMDEQTIRAYLYHYNGNAGPTDSTVFWCGIHKARTALRTLPMDERSKSKRWLLARGFRPEDDGEVPL